MNHQFAHAERGEVTRHTHIAPRDAKSMCRASRCRPHTPTNVDAVDLYDLQRPDHIDDLAWDAIELGRDRLQRAWEIEDYSEVVGKAKDIVETVAKVVVAATEGTISDSTDYASVVKSAMKSLRRQPGTDLSQDQELRAMAQAAQTIATSIAPIRNSYGTGHGRARNPKVVAEMASMVLESALMWSRWAIRRLGHLLADYPNDLIEAVQTGTTRHTLRQKFVDTSLAQQPVEIQHRIGVAFGQQSAGGFGNATEVGVQPAIDSEIDEFPIDYRRGLLQGMLFTADGSIGLTDYYGQQFVTLLASLPQDAAEELLLDLGEQLVGASWIKSWRGTKDVEPEVVVAALREEASRLPDERKEPFDGFCNGLVSRTDWRPYSGEY